MYNLRGNMIRILLLPRNPHICRGARWASKINLTYCTNPKTAVFGIANMICTGATFLAGHLSIDSDDTCLQMYLADRLGVRGVSQTSHIPKFMRL